jgi:hypothetical protein
MNSCCISCVCMGGTEHGFSRAPFDQDDPCYDGSFSREREFPLLAPPADKGGDESGIQVREGCFRAGLFLEGLVQEDSHGDEAIGQALTQARPKAEGSR